MPFLSMRIVQRTEVARGAAPGKVCVFARCALAVEGRSVIVLSPL
jgi:hypothetical protein